MILPVFYDVDITQPLLPVPLQPMLVTKDALANRIGVRLFEGKTPYSPGGTCAGFAVRRDGATVALTGAISGNEMYIDLPAAAYALEGSINIGIKNVNGSAETTVFLGMGTVLRGETDTVIDPGTIIPSVAALIADIDAAVASIPADYSALLATLAPTFSSSANYTAGQYVWNEGTLYRFTTNHAAGAWTGTDAVAAVVGADVADLKSAFDDVLVPSQETNTETMTQDSEKLTNYGAGAVSAVNGRFVTDTTHETFIFTLAENTSLYIVRTSANFLRIIEYNKTLETLPTSSSNSDYVRGASYEGSTNTLPTAESPWEVPAGHTIAISRANNSNYVTTFTLYYTVSENIRTIGENVVIPSANITENDVIRSLRNDYYSHARMKWVHAQKTGTQIVISEDNPINANYEKSKLLTILPQNLLNVAQTNFLFNSSTPNATLEKTETGVKIASTETGGSNRFVYFNIEAPAMGKMWISAYATCETLKTNDCRLVVLVNGQEIPPACVGNGLLKRYVEVNKNDTVQVRLWYHLSTSTAANEVEYEKIMISYGDIEYTAYNTLSTVPSKGSVMIFSESASVEYDYTEWNDPITCVCFGDSITGMFDNGADYCTMIEKIMPSKCVNAGFSGETWVDHPSAHYVPFSINRLIDAVVSSDFTFQDAHVGSITSDFYSKHLENLKNTNFNNVDVVTFLAGTNDWAFNIPLLSSDDPSTENKQRTNEQDAVTYCITQLLSKYPHLVIIVLLPYWRNRAGTEDSDLVPNNNGVYLYQFAETISKCAQAQNVKSIDLYKTLGANYTTRMYWTIDGTHPTTRTKMAIAKRIKDAIEKSGVL